MSISAMKCALQSLESVEKVKGWNKDSVIGRHCSQSAHFLRQAIEQAEKQEPIGEIVQAFEDLVAVSIPVMPPVGTKLYTAPVHAVDMSQERVDETDKDRHEWAMQKMVDENQRLGLYDDEQPTYQENRQVAPPPQREWVWLSDQDYEEIMKEKTYWYEVAKAVEIKSKEKNT
jgi:hypothetical protein